MPIDCPISFKRLTRDEFHDLDYTVMGQVFAIHNDLGRFCEEPIYKTDLAMRLRELGIDRIRTELPVTVCWKNLKVSLYQAALTELLGGKDRVIQRIPLEREGRLLGSQRIA